MNQITRPIIPYRGPISGGLHVGKKIVVIGHVPRGADRFTVNLQTGLESNSDRPFHISVRFELNVAVRNTLKNGSWGSEERSGPFPFAIGQNFTMRISVERSAYMISINGQHCYEYFHRIPFSRVTSIFIDGDVNIEKIQFINAVPLQSPVTYSAPSSPACVSPGYNIPPQSSVAYYPSSPVTYNPPYSPAYSSPGLNMPASPCIFPIYGGIRPGMCIYITGRPTASAPQRFTISLQNGAFSSPPDIGLQFDVRFYSNSIIRNSRTNNVWGLEESMITYFPFQPGVNFDIVIRIQSDAYVMTVNGQHFISFRHRMNVFSCINTLFLEKDIIVSSIRYT